MARRSILPCTLVSGRNVAVIEKTLIGFTLGFHSLPSFVWTEDYQCDLIEETTKAFDAFYANNTGFIGEMIWNFADFMTQQGVNRAYGNKKGIFTRQRQPKASAKYLRNRYWKLAKIFE